MKLSCLSLLAALVACASPATPTTAPAPPRAAGSPTASPPDTTAELDALIQTTLHSKAFVGASVAVARGGKLLLAKGYGKADLARDVPASPETVYRIGSITKQFTAVAILQLVERSQIRLDDDVRRYLPDYPAHQPPITIEHLLTHSSGIYDFTQLPDWLERGKQPMTRAQLVALFANHPLAFTPGSQFAYANSNYYLLGLVIEKVTGQPYANIVRDRIFGPAGMAASGYCTDAMPNHATGYAFKDGAPVPSQPLDLAHPYAAGALCSTVLDLLAWQRALEAGALLTPASLARMRADHVLTNGAPSGYGYGVFVDELAGHHRIAHAGGINGFLSQLTRFPSDDLTIAVLVNAEVDLPSKVDEAIARSLLHVPAPAVQHLALAPAARARFLGTYQLQGFPLKIDIFEKGDAIRLQATGQPAVTLLYQGDDRFVAELDHDIQLTFAAGAPAPSFALHQHGLTVAAVRAQQ